MRPETMKKNNIIISTASVAAAIQAIGGMVEEQRSLSVPANDVYRAEIQAALAGAQAQSMIRASMGAVATTLKIDDRLMQERYAEIESPDPKVVKFLARLADRGQYDIAQVSEIDSVGQGGGGDVFLNCYNNCHSACHGSRGWR
jgi:hypothetical protein